ncbi:hypothetical protein TSAR_004492 [Trichomalopsis sarcophagae]|uniref:Uncharacterized protein n=1 Tax=Trichomalopsis sarcophagae TaxID=543379 RepID=A0A232EU15_9HYME|nr:hypothetical protein TSAR_004492 [Trichomalopsis sarcophagae]
MCVADGQSTFERDEALRLAVAFVTLERRGEKQASSGIVVKIKTRAIFEKTEEKRRSFFELYNPLVRQATVHNVHALCSSTNLSHFSTEKMPLDRNRETQKSALCEIISGDGEGKRLLCAAEHTDRDRAIERLLQLEPGLSEIFPKGDKFSLLWIAVLRCYRQSAELLVRFGADVNELCGTKLAPFLSETISILHLILQTYPSTWNLIVIEKHKSKTFVRNNHIPRQN